MIPSAVIGHIMNTVQYKPAHMMRVESREGDSHYRVMRNSHRKIQIGVLRTLRKYFRCWVVVLQWYLNVRAGSNIVRENHARWFDKNTYRSLRLYGYDSRVPIPALK
jgi:hypothetical protein